VAEAPKSIAKSAAVLWLYAMIAGVLTVGLYLYTKDTIAEQRRLAQVRALTQIIDHNRYDNKLLEATVVLPDPEQLGQPEGAEGYLAKRAGEVTAVILPLTVADGYSGEMRLIVGIESKGKITGVRVLSHNETPGLGDKVEARKSDWIHTFVGRSLTDPEQSQWKVKKDGGVFDQFTGATITPRAVVKGVLNSLHYFEQYQQRLTVPGASDKPAAKDTKGVSDE